MTWWAWAGEWQSSTVTCDGVDVLDRCRGIFFRGERPVALELYVRRQGNVIFRPPPWSWEDGSFVTEIIGGEIIVGGLVRRAGGA